MEQSTPISKVVFASKDLIYLTNHGLAKKWHELVKPRWWLHKPAVWIPTSKLYCWTSFAGGSIHRWIWTNSHQRKCKSQTKSKLSVAVIWFIITAKVLVHFQEGYITKFYQHTKCILKTLFCPPGLGHTAPGTSKVWEGSGKVEVQACKSQSGQGLEIHKAEHSEV